MFERRQHLLDERALSGPRFFGTVLSLGGTAAMAETLNDRATAVDDMQIRELDTAVIIDGRALPNKHGKMPGGEKERVDSVIATARNIRTQSYSGNIVIAATVDAAMFDPSAKQRRAMDDLGVRPLRMNHGVNHAAAINSASSLLIPEGVGISIPAGNRFATDQALRAASLHVGNGAVGVFGPRVLDRGASNLAHRLLHGDSEYTMQYAEPDNSFTADQTGFMSDSGSAFNALALNGYPLDEAYGTGGGLRDWAHDMQSSYPDGIWYDPAMAVHDATGRNMSKWSLLDEVMREDPTDYPS